MEMLFLTPGDPRWATFLEGVPHDFYHLPAYNQLSAGDGEEPTAVLIEDGSSYFFLPFLIRPIPASSHRDASAAYGYPGLLARAEDPEFLSRAARLWADAMSERAIISCFVRMHPLLSPESVPGTGEMLNRGTTISVDLSADLAALWRATRKSTRHRINQLTRQGYRSYMDPEFARQDAFLEIYEETMKRCGADSGYFFSRAYFTGLREALGERLWLCAVDDPQGRVVCAGLFTECSGLVQFHLSGTLDAAMRASPSIQMLDFVRRWAQERGNHLLHLGGGVGGKEDSLFQFKAAFSKRRHVFRTWQLVFSPGEYDALVGREGAKDRGGFFPAYRA